MGGQLRDATGTVDNSRIAGSKTATAIRPPQGRAGEVECDARRAVVLSLVCALEPIVAAISQLERQIAMAVREHPDGEIVPRSDGRGALGALGDS